MSRALVKGDPAPQQARRIKKWLPFALVWSLVAVLYGLGNLSFIDNKIADWRFQLATRPASGDLALVEIDAKSLAALDTWPWPRRYHAEVLDRLMAAGAARVAVDVDFSARSNPEDDALLADALTRAGKRVILPASVQPITRVGGMEAYTTTFPLKEFRDAVSLGSIVVHPQKDSLVRTLNTRYAIGDTQLPTVAMRLAEPVDTEAASFVLDYGIDLSTIPRLSYADVLNGDFDPKMIAGKRVVIGATAAELGDQIPVPVYFSLPGALIHALGYESLVQGRALLRPAILPALMLLLLIALGAQRCLADASLRRSVAVLGGFVAGSILLSVVLQAFWPILLDVASWILVVTLLFVVELTKRVNRQSIQLLVQNRDLRRKDILMRHVVDNSIVGILTFSLDGTIESINPAAQRMFGYKAEQIEGTNVSNLLADSVNVENAKDLLRVSESSQELVGLKRDGSSFPMEVSVNVVNFIGRQLCTAFVNDLTERKQQQVLAHQALHDSLTDLPNRKKFCDSLSLTLAEAKANGRMLAVMLLDLDRFKAVNDTLGHLVGDQLLQTLAERVRAIMPDDAVFARFGGDEFAILVPNVAGMTAAEDFARFVIAEIELPFFVNNTDLNISASIGIAVYPQDGATEEQLIQRADVAMYSAKTGRRGVSFYCPKTDPNSLRNLDYTGELRRAIENNELALAYQPKLDVQSRTLVGAEALVRWARADNGLVPPEELVHHAEQFGLMMPLTKWVLNSALAQGAAWREKGLDINVAVNVSASLLHHAKLIPTIVTQLRHWDYPASRLTIEVTENALLVNPEGARIAGEQLADIGVHLSIDDFGTGYSSLQYLRTLSAHELKIDKSFVVGIEENPSDNAIVRSVIAMAHELGLKVVAEGVENERVFSLLHRFGCDTSQGFLVGRPMSQPDFDLWLRENHWTNVHETPAENPQQDIKRGFGNIVRLADNSSRAQQRAISPKKMSTG